MHTLKSIIILSFTVVLCLGQSPEDFIRAKGNQLVVGSDEQAITLRGVGFINDVDWLTYKTLSMTVDHSEIDFQRIHEMGMNVVRFELDYRFFEDDSIPYVYQPEGWAWLDTNLAWARKYGVYMILDMHISAGGIQEGNVSGKALWTDPEKQKRVKALWYTFADRYKNDTIVAAYDLINEPYPFPPDSHQLWTALAQEIIDTIRTVDTNHLVIVEECFGDIDHYLSTVNDKNVMYDVHYYLPHRFSHFYNSHGDGGYYPDPGVSLTGDYLMQDAFFADSSLTSKVPAGNTDWALYETPLYQVIDSLMVEAVPIIICNTTEGIAYFDDFILKEFDSNQSLVRQQLVDMEYNDGTWFLPGKDTIKTYIGNWKVQAAQVDLNKHDSTYTAHAGKYALKITGITQPYRLRNKGYGFLVKPDHYYKLSGWMKGVDMNGQGCRMGIEYYKHNQISDITPFDKSYSKNAMLAKLQFSIDNNVPMNIGEFGLMRWCFMDSIGSFNGNRGGLQWVEDILDLFDTYNLSYQYFAYHSHDFGLYYNHGDLPNADSSNSELIDLFTTNLVDINHSKTPKVHTMHLLCTSPVSLSNVTIIHYFVLRSSSVSLNIYDAHGRMVKELVNKNQLPGKYTVRWHRATHGSGVYFLTLNAGSTATAQKTLVLH